MYSATTPLPLLNSLDKKPPEDWASELIGPKDVSDVGVLSHTDIWTDLK